MEDPTVCSCIRVVFISHCFCQGCAALSVSPKQSSSSCFHPLYGGYSSTAVCSTFGPRLFPSTVFLRNLHTLFCCGFLFYAALTALNSVPICLNLDFFFLFSAFTLPAPVLPVSAPRMCMLLNMEKPRSQTAHVD